MTLEHLAYETGSGIRVSRSMTQVAAKPAIEEILTQLDTQRGGLLTSSYEYPGRYKRWAMGFVDPPLELTAREQQFSFVAHNERGQMLLRCLLPPLQAHPQLQITDIQEYSVSGLIKPEHRSFTEEERSQQPSVFTVVREVLKTFSSDQDEHLGLYGAFGYDLVFQFEAITKYQQRPSDQRDIVLYLPDRLVVVDQYSQRAYRYEYEFEAELATDTGSSERCQTAGLSRSTASIDYLGQHRPLTSTSDHAVGEYANQVWRSLDSFRRGDLFEVVLSQSFFETCDTAPSQLFHTLQQINPSPYGFLFNLSGEYLIGASPEMFVRVEGRRVETCPISGTIQRGKDAIEDAEKIRQLLNSYKDEVELTMCTDVDRNDKSRICEPGSVQVIGRRQIELYSHLIHTVDHVEGMLRPEFDALDAFLTHTWAVTVTGAPKRGAIQFIEQNEQSARQWYGGAIGRLTFDGNLNTGLNLRMIRLKDAIAEVRVGATLLFDSLPKAEEQETLTKAAAMLETLHLAKHNLTHTAATPNQTRQYLSGQTITKPGFQSLGNQTSTATTQAQVLLVDYEDSFVHTLANYIRQCGATVKTLRHGFPLSLLDQERPELVVLSPGPGRPSEFQMSNLINACLDRNIPMFGVCLGLQGLVEAFGGILGVLAYPQHGKPSRIFVTDPKSTLFRGLSESFEVGRYHSLFAVANALPKELKVTAISGDDVIMAIEHRTLPIAAVQFHPESIMTLGGNVGLHIIQNAIYRYTSVAAIAPEDVIRNAIDDSVLTIS